MVSMALNPRELNGRDAFAEMLGADVIEQINAVGRAATWNVFGKNKPEPEAPKAESVMAPEELQAKLAGYEMDDPNRTPELDKGIEPGSEAELYAQHMITMAAGMGVDEIAGMNIDELTDAVQRAHDNPQSGAQNPQIGADAITNFLGGDIKEMNLAEIEQAGSPLPAAAIEHSVDPHQVG